jgi:hypothetical protein
VPSLIDIGGMVKLTKYFGAGINFGLVPEIEFSYYGDATVSYQSYDAFGHIHPFGGGFFLGARIGYAAVEGSYASDIRVSSGSISGTLTYDSRAKVKTMVLTPELGYLYTFDSGFTFGVDFGAQIPVAPQPHPLRKSGPHRSARRRRSRERREGARHAGARRPHRAPDRAFADRLDVVRVR